MTEYRVIWQRVSVSPVDAAARLNKACEETVAGSLEGYRKAYVSVRLPDLEVVLSLLAVREQDVADREEEVEFEHAQREKAERLLAVREAELERLRAKLAEYDKYVAEFTKDA